MLIQVFSFQTFRKRVFLMAPIHHHFELMALVGDEDHPALLDRRRDLRGDRLHDLPGSRSRSAHAACRCRRRPWPRRRARALGRRGRASAAGARRARCSAVDAGTPELPGDIPAVTRHATGWRSSTTCAAVVKSPGVPRAGAGDRRGARRGLPVMGELELAWRLRRQRVHRGDGHERQDDDGGAARRDPPRGGRAGRGRGQRRHRVRLAGRQRPAAAPSSSARRRRSSSRTRWRSPRRRPSC